MVDMASVNWSPHLAPDRQARIAQLIQERTSMSVQDLSRYFGVSAMTIRRDLHVLEEKGLVYRIHGGAITPQTSMGSGEEARASLHTLEKAAIGAAAAGIVAEGQTLFIDAGTTTFELAARLRERRGVTIVTNAIRILSLLVDAPGINLIGIGGSVFGGARSFVGPLAEAALRQFNADIAFMGITSLSVERGLTEVNFFEAAIKSLAIQRARRVILLADHSKFGKMSPVQVCDLARLDMIITDADLPQETAQAYRTAGVEMMVVPFR